MKNANRKLSRTLNNLWRTENQSLIEFFLLFTLVVSATAIGGLTLVYRVDAVFRNIGTMLNSYTR